ncbi:MAG: VOC family protein, partial [Mycobacteriales bacterium]
TVHASGLVAIDFLPVPEAKTVKNRLHLDLRGVSYEGAVQRAVELGATRADDVYAGEGWQVLRDPEGNEFCILSKPYTD